MKITKTRHGNNITDRIVSSLRERGVEFELPKESNFRDIVPKFQLSPSSFKESPQVRMYEDTRSFSGFYRGKERGVGTRNYGIIVGLTSRTSSFARLLADRARDMKNHNFDGVVPVCHTELGRNMKTNNVQLVLRTLAGFIVHSNVAFSILIDDRNGDVSKRLCNFMKSSKYPLKDCRNKIVILGHSSFESEIKEAEQMMRSLVKHSMKKDTRTRQPLSELCVALQCGGSDAFSGISANPLIGAVSRELIRNGGSAIQAETDELMGAEKYFLRHCRDERVAKSFLSLIVRFKKRLEAHGASPESNPSGGNIYRGLYNIALKSIGAAQKKASDVRLDHVLEYGERKNDRRGFIFMDSPGNDLESIAGQVSSGCQMVMFTSGNGAVTNFPFVPTIKVVTTTRRFNLLRHDMDFNAGRYQDGESFESLTRELFEHVVHVADGMKVLGEREGSNPPQVSLWRDWFVKDKVTDDDKKEKEQEKERKQDIDDMSVDEKKNFTSLPILDALPELSLHTPSIGLILPTSLCSSETSRLIANELNSMKQEDETFCKNVTRFGYLETTEGCGVVGNDFFHKNVLVGILRSPLIKFAVLLEHGCEKNHNDSMRKTLKSKFESIPSNIGFESVQLGGGVRRAVSNVMRQCRRLSEATNMRKKEKNLRVGLVVDTTSLNQVDIDSLKVFCRAVIDKWTGTIVSPRVPCLNGFETMFKTRFVSLGDTISEDAGMVLLRGLDCCSMTLSETIGCVASTGVHVLVVLSTTSDIVQAHPLIPTIFISSSSSSSLMFHDVDVRLNHGVSENAMSICDVVASVVSSKLLPYMNRIGNVHFQFSRGRTGVSV